MTTEDEAVQPETGSPGHAVLGAAGEAVAFFAGAPIAGAADAAAGLGDVVADREARLEEAITRRHAPDVPARRSLLWMWLVLLVLIVAGLVFALDR